MIIHQDSLMVLDYEPKTDILTVKWPDLIDVSVTVIESSFTRLSDAIKHYHITRLLLDSKNSVNNVSDEEYKPLIIKLVINLMNSNLKKIARIVSGDPEREKRAGDHSAEIQSKMTFNFVNKEFADKESAIAWLLENDA